MGPIKILTRNFLEKTKMYGPPTVIQKKNFQFLSHFGRGSRFFYAALSKTSFWGVAGLPYF